MTYISMNDTQNAISSVGNFKGIMLCSRPCEGDGIPIAGRSTANNNEHGNVDNGSFICGIIKKPWGNNVVISEKSRVLCRLSYKDSALSKHKKWLSDLQKEREKRELEHREEKVAKDERIRQFKEREARKRERALAEEREDAGECCLADVTEEKERTTVPQHQSTSETHGERQPKRQQHTASNPPAWALTELEAENAKETSTQQEQEELLAFVQGLDFDKFDYDLELRLLMNQVKDRIKSLERETQKDEARLKAIEDCEIAAEKSMEFNQVDVFDGKGLHPNMGGGDRDENDVQSIAETVMSSDNGLMGYIHSRRSVEALVSKSKERIGGSGGKIGTSGAPATDTIIAEEQQFVEHTFSPPVMITHKDDEGARLAEMKSLSKLPFKNRNPAI